MGPVLVGEINSGTLPTIVSRTGSATFGALTGETSAGADVEGYATEERDVQKAEAEALIELVKQSVDGVGQRLNVYA